jgi:glutathione synthase/RimK-type ligase-like ATP-grasp enzyme
MRVVLARKSPSEGARHIAAALGIKRVSPEIKGKPQLIINWGCSSLAYPQNSHLINSPQAVALAINKLNCGLTLEEHSVRTVNFFSGKYSDVRKKFPDDIIVARHKLNGSCGDGIQIIRPDDPPPEKEAKAYCPYIRKSTEFRVHVAFGKVIHVTEKRKRVGAEPSTDEKLVRNVGNVWVFCENDLSCDERKDRTQLEAISTQAIKALGLHFGAVDLLFSKKGEYVVCEVNTKPGVASTATLDAYVNAFKTELGI